MANEFPAPGHGVAYLALVEGGKCFFFERRIVVRPLAPVPPAHERRVHRVAAAHHRPLAGLFHDHAG